MTNNDPQENRIMRIIASIIVGIFGSILGLALAILIFGGISYAYLLTTDWSFESAGTMVIGAGAFCLVPFGLTAMLSAGTFAGKVAYGVLSSMVDSQPDDPVRKAKVEEEANLVVERPSKIEQTAVSPPNPAADQPVEQKNRRRKIASIIIGLIASLLGLTPFLFIIAIMMYLSYFNDDGLLALLSLLCLTPIGLAAMTGAGLFAGKTAYRKLGNSDDGQPVASVGERVEDENGRFPLPPQPGKGIRREKKISLTIIAIGGLCLMLFILARIFPLMPSTERDALKALGYDPGWQSPCHIRDIYCDGSPISAHVKTLNIDHDLTTIPPEIGQLSYLRFLNVGNNHIHTISPEIGQLAHLERLHLPYNELQTIPAEVGDLISLETISIYSNQITSIPPEVGNLPNLRSLRLSYNAITMIPPELGKISSLEELKLNNNPINGRLPLELSTLSQLRKFTFHQTDACEPQDADFQEWLAGITVLISNDIACPQ